MHFIRNIWFFPRDGCSTTISSSFSFPSIPRPRAFARRLTTSTSLKLCLPPPRPTNVSSSSSAATGASIATSSTKPSTARKLLRPSTNPLKWFTSTSATWTKISTWPRNTTSLSTAAYPPLPSSIPTASSSSARGVANSKPPVLSLPKTSLPSSTNGNLSPANPGGLLKPFRLFVLLLFPLFLAAQQTHPILATGSLAPDFSLPGVDGKMHSLADYSSSPVLVVVFTCNHCPIAQMYEQRIQQLADDYRDRGVALVAIQPNDPKALRIDELDSSDISDSLDEMKIRVAYKHLRYPYLYDGETQSVARAYGPQATPHVFIFDETRHLRYEGRVDNSYRTELVRTNDARNVIEALLAHKDPPA